MTITFPTIWHLFGTILVLGAAFSLSQLLLDVVFGLLADAFNQSKLTLLTIAVIGGAMLLGVNFNG